MKRTRELQAREVESPARAFSMPGPGTIMQTPGGPGIAIGHVGGRLLVARHDKLDVVSGVAESVDGPVELHARYAEDDFHAFAAQLFDQRLAPGDRHAPTPHFTAARSPGGLIPIQLNSLNISSASPQFAESSFA